MDREVNKFIVVKKYKNSSLFVDQVYCYYVFQSIIDPKEITPKLFGDYIKGGTLSLEYVPAYNQWLSTESGLSCKTLVGKNFKFLKSNGQQVYAIYLNLNAIKAEGKDLDQTLNHEKLHVAFSLYKNKREKINKLWEGLTKKERQRFKSEHPGYNFENSNVLMREFFAYKFQNNYSKGLELLL